MKKNLSLKILRLEHLIECVVRGVRKVDRYCAFLNHDDALSHAMNVVSLKCDANSFQLKARLDE